MNLGKDAPRALLIGRVDACGEPVLAVVHEFDRLAVVLDLLDADDRSEALVAHQRHAVVDIDEYRRLEPIALAPDDLAAGQQPCSFALGVGDLVSQDVELQRAGDRADIGRLVHRVADLVAFDFGDKRRDERIVDFFVNVDALDRAARLSRVVEGAVGDARCSGLDVDILADIDGVLAAQL